jgi:hypothetical protein
LPAPHASDIQAYLASQPDRFAAIQRMFERWPALTSILIARRVAERIGENTGVEIYPHLAQLIGVPEVPLTRRAPLANWFRRACQTLGIPVLHRTGRRQDNIHEYLLQAGIPFTQISEAARAFARTEGDEGLSDPDDDAACALWSAAAAERAPIAHARLRFVLEEDASGYYARLWCVLEQSPKL